MSPRADFACLTCVARFDDLPLRTYTCPECGDGLARIWDARGSAAVGRHASPYVVHDTVGLNEHEKAKLVDQMVQPQWEAQHKVKTHDPNFKTHLVRSGSTFGGLPVDARAWSRGVAAPIINNIPFPAPNVQGGPPVIVPPPHSKPTHLTGGG